MRFIIFPRIFPKLVVCCLTFLVCSAMGFLCLPLNGSPAFYHGFPVNSLLSSLSISRVFLCVSGDFRALSSSCFPRCGAPEFHQFPVGSPVTFLYIPHMSACISLICFRYPACIPPSIFLSYILCSLLLVKQQTRDNTRIAILHKEDRKTKAYRFVISRQFSFSNSAYQCAMRINHLPIDLLQRCAP